MMFVSWRCCFLPRWARLDCGLHFGAGMDALKGRSAVRSRDLGADPTMYLLFGNNLHHKLFVSEVESSISIPRAFVTDLCVRICLIITDF
jgi:hypothetical protein